MYEMYFDLIYPQYFHLPPYEDPQTCLPLNFMLSSKIVVIANNSLGPVSADPMLMCMGPSIRRMANLPVGHISKEKWSPSFSCHQQHMVP